MEASDKSRPSLHLSLPIYKNLDRQVGRNGVISNIVTDFVPFLYPLHDAPTVTQYLLSTPVPGQISHNEKAYLRRRWKKKGDKKLKSRGKSEGSRQPVEWNLSPA